MLMFYYFRTVSNVFVILNAVLTHRCLCFSGLVWFGHNLLFVIWMLPKSPFSGIFLNSKAQVLVMYFLHNHNIFLRFVVILVQPLVEGVGLLLVKLLVNFSFIFGYGSPTSLTFTWGFWVWGGGRGTAKLALVEGFGYGGPTSLVFSRRSYYDIYF